MKNLLALIIFAMTLSCGKPATKNTPAASQEVSANFDWLLGDWQRSNDAENQQTSEHWEKSKTGDYSGIGFTLQNQDTVFKENMSLVKLDDVWNLKVDIADEDPTYFTFSALEENKFICVNPENDFPKKITYERKGNNLFANISDDKNAVAFVFVKKR